MYWDIKLYFPFFCHKLFDYDLMLPSSLFKKLKKEKALLIINFQPFIQKHQPNCFSIVQVM